MSELHVVFGAGPLGKWTARELDSLGRKVRIVCRSGKAQGLPSSAELVAGDAFVAASNIELTVGATAVYQCAQPPYHEWQEKFPHMQESIMAAAERNDARFVVGDNLYMYGNPGVSPLTENRPYAFSTKKGRVRAAMADAVMKAHKAGRIRAAVGRASNFFGPDDHVMTDLLIRPAVEGKMVNLLGKLNQLHSYSYVPDFGKLLANLGTREEALGQVWFTPSPPPVRQAELIELLAKEVGRPVKTRVAGKGMLSFLGHFNPTLRETVEMIYEWTGPFVIDSSKAEKAFEWKGTPLAEAIRATVAWCRATPE